MASNGRRIFILIILAIVVVVALVLGLIHIGTSAPPPPTAQITVSQSSVSVQSGQKSSEESPITFSLQNVQNANNTVFDVDFTSSNQSNVYAVYFNGTHISVVNTNPLIGVEPYTSQPFLIYGKKPAGVTSSVGYNITLSLYYKGNLIGSKTIQVTVN